MSKLMETIFFGSDVPLPKKINFYYLTSKKIVDVKSDKTLDLWKSFYMSLIPGDNSLLCTALGQSKLHSLENLYLKMVKHDLLPKDYNETFNNNVTN